MSRRKRQLKKIYSKGKLTPDRFRGKIFALLHKRLRFAEGFRAEYAYDLASEIIQIAYKDEPKSLWEIHSKSSEPLFITQRIRFSILAGKFSYWEVLLKNICHNLGINIYEEIDGRKSKSPRTKDIEYLKDEIVARFPKLNFNFKRIINLRNATVHGNFHQIRSTYLEGKSKKIRSAAKENVVAVDLSTNKQSPENLGELVELEAIKKHGLFAWFLGAANSTVINGVMKELNAHIFLLNNFQGYWSLCFDEFENYRLRLEQNGFDLKGEEMELFYSRRKDFDLDGDQFRSCFRSLREISRD